MLKSDNLTAIAKALVAAQKEMGIALKDSKNPFFKSKYADLNAVIDAAVPALNKQNIAVLQLPVTIETISGTSKSVLRTMLLHESGEHIASDTDIICAKPNDPQAMGSAISYARRYGLQAAAVLKAEDDDGNAGAGKTEVKETVKVEAATSAPSAAAKKISFARKASTETTKTVDTGDDI